MKKYTIGIVREGKVPPDNRVPLTPRQCSELVEKYTNLDIRIEWSPFRCYTDEDYMRFGVGVQEHIAHCDLLMGIKEVPIDKLIPGQTYMFFSHTAKKQPHNRPLLRAILDKQVTIIDYELLTDENGVRLIGFGRWAGIVGTHYALVMLGERTGAFKLKCAKDCLNLQEVTDQYDNIQIPPVKMVITGGGRVAQGALEIMHKARIKQVTKEDYLSKTFDEPVFVQLHSQDLYKRISDGGFDKQEFYHHPDKYENAFEPFIPVTDILINCMFWDPRAPRLFEEEQTKAPDFKMKIIADISCDIDGSCPITHRATSSEDPVMGYHADNGAIGKPYQKDTIDVMAISNLPNELPRDASRDFGIIMMHTVIPRIMSDSHDALFERATIASNGQLTPRFSYLQDWVDGKED